MKPKLSPYQMQRILILADCSPVRYFQSVVFALLITIFALPAQLLSQPSKGLNVYQDIPGITTPTLFSSNVRIDGSSVWCDLITKETVGNPEGPYLFERGTIDNGVAGNSATWGNFGMDVPVIVEVTKESAGDIKSWITSPQSFVSQSINHFPPPPVRSPALSTDFTFTANF